MLLLVFCAILPLLICSTHPPAMVQGYPTIVCPQGFMWRDCKPENILLARTGRQATVKLADFGLSIDSTEERPVTRAGTLDYMAPEVQTELCLCTQFQVSSLRAWNVTV